MLCVLPEKEAREVPADDRMLLRSSHLVGVLLVAKAGMHGADGATCPDTGDGWTTVNLDSTIGYVAQHKVDPLTSVLHLRLTAESTGWLGFGFAPCFRF